MTSEQLAAVDRAEALFREGFSCSQAMLMAFGPGLGLDEPHAALVSSAFGGGMARQGWTCGALTGAMMTLGLRAGYTTAQDTATKDALYAKVQALVEAFEAQHGATACRQLVGVNMLDPVDRQAASDRGVFATLCPALVRTAASLVAKELEAAAPLRG
jgi:C_GCAxxG_C_C family probable redox protein